MMVAALNMLFPGRGSLFMLALPHCRQMRTGTSKSMVKGLLLGRM
jgi:hypothetical protein